MHQQQRRAAAEASVRKPRGAGVYRLSRRVEEEPRGCFGHRSVAQAAARDPFVAPVARIAALAAEDAARVRVLGRVDRERRPHLVERPSKKLLVGHRYQPYGASPATPGFVKIERPADSCARPRRHRRGDRQEEVRESAELRERKPKEGRLTELVGAVSAQHVPKVVRQRPAVVHPVVLGIERWKIREVGLLAELAQADGVEAIAARHSRDTRDRSSPAEGSPSAARSARAHERAMAARRRDARRVGRRGSGDGCVRRCGHPLLVRTRMPDPSDPDRE